MDQYLTVAVPKRQHGETIAAKGTWLGAFLFTQCASILHQGPISARSRVQHASPRRSIDRRHYGRPDCVLNLFFTFYDPQAVAQASQVTRTIVASKFSTAFAYVTEVCLKSVAPPWQLSFSVRHVEVKLGKRGTFLSGLRATRVSSLQLCDHDQ
jgi:hypothetical protein